MQPGDRDRSDSLVLRGQAIDNHLASPAMVSATSIANEKQAVNSDDGVAAGNPGKVLFLHGVSGFVTTTVVTQHSGYMGDVNLGASAVDVFFVLSAFLLTMLFDKKCTQLMAQRASYRKWFFTLVDYFSKRFFRVYPLFAVVAIVPALMSYKYQKQYYLVKICGDYNLFQVLTFDFPHRYHVFWTLPLEISYYFMVPVFVVVLNRLKWLWCLLFAPLYVWIVRQGWTKLRGDHQPLGPHFPTFVAGSLAAIIFVKLEAWIERSGSQFRL